MKKELDDSCAVTIKMVLQVHYRMISLLPDSFLVEQLVRQPLAEQDLWMHTNDQHLLIIGTVKDANPTAFWQTLGGTPQKIVIQFCSARVFKAEHLAALW